MTDQEMRIAIAEAWGWTSVFVATGKEEWLGTFACEYEGKLLGFYADQSKDDHAHEIPDYVNDLNAMHEVETMLTADQAIKFRLRLSENSGRRNSEFPTVEAAMCHATARQRAEAFLRTIGKWRDG